MKKTPRHVYSYLIIFKNQVKTIYMYLDITTLLTKCSAYICTYLHIKVKKINELCSWLFPGVHILKQSVPRQYNVRKTQSFDPIPPVAKEISNEAWLLCFDEFQVPEFSLLSSRAHLHVHKFENENFKMIFSFECHHELNFKYLNIVFPKI